MQRWASRGDERGRRRSRASQLLERLDGLPGGGVAGARKARILNQRRVHDLEGPLLARAQLPRDVHAPHATLRERTLDAKLASDEGVRRKLEQTHETLVERSQVSLRWPPLLDGRFALAFAGAIAGVASQSWHAAEMQVHARIGGRTPIVRAFVSDAFALSPGSLARVLEGVYCGGVYRTGAPLLLR